MAPRISEYAGGTKSLLGLLSTNAWRNDSYIPSDVKPAAVAAAIERAKAHAGNAIESKSRLAQDLDHAEVGERTRTAAREDDPERSPRQSPGAHLQRRHDLSRVADDLHLAGLEYVQDAVRDRGTEDQQLAAIQGAGVRQPTRPGHPMRDREHEVCLAQAQLGPVICWITSSLHDHALSLVLSVVDRAELAAIELRHRPMVR